MKPFNFLLPLILLSSTLYGENRQRSVDSLRSILKTCSPDTSKVNILIQLSNELYEMDAYPEALAYATDANRLSEALGFKTGVASANKRIGATYIELGRYPEAIESLLKAMKIYESIKDAHGIAMVNNHLGSIYYFQQDFNKALEHYFKSYKYKSNDGLTSANIAMVYIAKNNYSIALEYLYKALQYFQAEGNINGASTILNNIGTVYDFRNMNDSALACYFKALDIKQKIQDYKGQAETEGSIGDVYYKKKQFSTAIKHQNNSLILSKKIGYLNSTKQTEYALYEIYNTMHEPDKALEHYRNYINIRDSLYNEENTKKTIRSEMNHQFEAEQERIKSEQDKKDAIQNEILKRRQVLIISFSSGFGLILIFSFFLFINYKKIRKSKDIIFEQKKLVECNSKEIADNIIYAKRIQDAIMPSASMIMELLPNSFIFNRARDIVSGDFYFAEKVSDSKIIFAVADSTSHSVSGAMMSMLNSNLLNEAVRNGIHTPSKILDYVNIALARAFHQTGEQKAIKDGMDICLCSFDSKTMILEFSGAYNPLLIMRNNEVIELMANKLELGQAEENYTNHEFLMQAGDMIYLSSDGYADQFGGDKNKKYKYKNFTSLLCKTSPLSPEEQCLAIAKEFDSYKGLFEQTDDVLVMGIRI